MTRPGFVLVLALSGVAGAGLAVAATAKPPHPPPGKPPPKTTTVTSTTTVSNTTTVVHTTPGSTVTRSGGGGGGGGVSGGSSGGEVRTVTQVVTIRVPQGHGITPGPATIRVTLRELRPKLARADRRTSHVYLILNRPSYRQPIGRAVMICNQADVRLLACRAYFSFSRGQIVLGGLVTTFRFFRLAVLGGTGFYDTTGGSAVIQQIGSDAWSVVIGLQGL